MKVRAKIIKLTILMGGLFLAGAVLIGGSLNGNFLTDEADGLVLAKPALAQTTGLNYYHFNYPNANKLMIIASK